MDVERATTELKVEGQFDEAAKEEYPSIVKLMTDVLEHGEVHAKWADSDQKVEVRQGTATFDFDGEVVILDDGITQHRFAMAQVVHWEKPMNVYEMHE